VSTDGVTGRGRARGGETGGGEREKGKKSARGSGDSPSLLCCLTRSWAGRRGVTGSRGGKRRHSEPELCGLCGGLCLCLCLCLWIPAASPASSYRSSYPPSPSSFSHPSPLSPHLTTLPTLTTLSSLPSSIRSGSSSPNSLRSPGVSLWVTSIGRVTSAWGGRRQHRGG